jgi:hypothetical protein
MALKRAAAAPGRAGDGLVHDPLDGAGAPTALGAAAKTAIDLAGRAGSHRRGDGATDIVVAEHVAGANDHEQKPNIAEDRENTCMNYLRPWSGSKGKNPSLSNSKLVDEKPGGNKTHGAPVNCQER